MLNQVRNIISPQRLPFQPFDHAEKAWEQLLFIYERNCDFIRRHFSQYTTQKLPENQAVRAFYPALRLHITHHHDVDSRLSYGFVEGPGVYETTVTRPDLFKQYLIEQIDLLIKNHQTTIEIGESNTPIPLHFCFNQSEAVDEERNAILTDAVGAKMLNHFDVPNLAQIDDAIVNGTYPFIPGKAMPLAPFTAARVDYSLQRLQHYTGTKPLHFQQFILFTNYQFYVEEFCNYAREQVQNADSGYTELILPGNIQVDKLLSAEQIQAATAGVKKPQMPAYHLKRADGSGITLVNIGVGPSNAKTITDHIAVLRPAAWLMVGHCAGLRSSQQLGDYVLAHAYVREDHVLDEDLPLFVPIPALAEIQVALEDAVEEISGLKDYELKRIMRTGTVASIDNRNWELRYQEGPVQRLSQSRAIALDMESATIAANGFRFRVPYGTLLCVSDKPLHGELKLPGMATEFYRIQVAQHLKIGIRALEILRNMPKERIHSRKLRSFIETAFH
ncbi:AMP nucleosidase [Oligella sp. MSHR50489EDL]|uniref:AMP nucleosidase n=1 Tax=Oligella sp. MSHR50489EDL TaxID=3139409 RepID=UPI003D8185E0